MRGILVALLILASPAAAQEWGHYVDEKYGYEIDIPSGFEEVQSPTLGPNEHYYKTPTSDLLINTFYQKAEEFEAEEQEALFTLQNDFHWTTLESVITPTEASRLLTKGGKQFRTKVMQLCGVDYAVQYRLEYFAANAQLYAPVIERLDRSFRRPC